MNIRDQLAIMVLNGQVSRHGHWVLTSLVDASQFSRHRLGLAPVRANYSEYFCRDFESWRTLKFIIKPAPPSPQFL